LIRGEDRVHMIVRPRVTRFLSVTIGAVAIATISDAGVTQPPSISGRVIDAAGWPVPGAFVTTTEESGGRPIRATTGPDGTYQFAALPDGTYRIDFELTGFDLMRRNHLPVRSDATAVVGDVRLYVSAVCECVNVRWPATLRDRPGVVTDEAGRPLALARLQIVTSRSTEAAYTESEGRFRLRVPVNEHWALTASASGFIAATQQVSGVVGEPVVFKLRPSGTPLPDIERFHRVCCPSDLFAYQGR
jgi:carboxypeptidase family protein